MATPFYPRVSLLVAGVLLFSAAPAFATLLAPGQTIVAPVNPSLLNPFTSAVPGTSTSGSVLADGTILNSGTFQLSSSEYLYAYQITQKPPASFTANTVYYNAPFTAAAALYLPVSNLYSVDVYSNSVPAGLIGAPTPTVTRSDDHIILSGFGNAVTSSGNFSETIFLLVNRAPAGETIQYTPTGNSSALLTTGLSVPAPVPEPMSLALLPLAVAGLAWRCRRAL